MAFRKKEEKKESGLWVWMEGTPTMMNISIVYIVYFSHKLSSYLESIYGLSELVGVVSPLICT